MTDYSLHLNKVTMIFGRRLIFEEIDKSLKSGVIYGLAGSNGSGKSTLSKIMCGLLTPTKGKIVHHLNGKEIKEEKVQDYSGFVSPYLILYDEFTAWENLFHFSKIRGMNFDENFAKELMDSFGIYDRRNDYFKGYSSGMKQRMKFIFALLHNPAFLMFDEPTSNLDNAGKEKVYEIIKKYGKDKLVVIASNEDTDLAQCDEIIQVEDYKRKRN